MKLSLKKFSIFLLATAAGVGLIANTIQTQNLLKEVASLQSTLNTLNESVVASLVNTSAHQAPAATDLAISENIFYIDPVNGSSSGDGSKDSPWQSLNDVIKSGLVESQKWNALPYVAGSSYLIPMNPGAPIKGGDTIYLMSGNYGNFIFRDYYNQAPITIKAYPGQTAVFDSIQMLSSANWVFDGVKIIKSANTISTGALFSAKKHGFRGPIENITLKNAYISSGEDTSAWTTVDWDLARTGVESDVINFVMQNTTLRNVGHGITSTGEKSLIEHNTINYFARDGLRALGNYSTYQFNLIKNSIQTGSGNHDDAIQSWVIDGVSQKGSVLHANTIIDYEDPNQPFSSASPTGVGLQGIGFFDGPFVDWVVTDNVIIVDHYHGITFTDSNSATISNNTVVPRNFNGDQIPWILLSSKGRNTVIPSINNVVVNNVVAKSVFTNNGVTTEDNTLEDNLTGSVVTPDIFVDYANFDLRLNETGQMLVDALYAQEPLENVIDEIPTTEEVVEETTDAEVASPVVTEETTSTSPILEITNVSPDGTVFPTLSPTSDLPTTDSPTFVITNTSPDGTVFPSLSTTTSSTLPTTSTTTIETTNVSPDGTVFPTLSTTPTTSTLPTLTTTSPDGTVFPSTSTSTSTFEITNTSPDGTVFPTISTEPTK